MNENVPNEVQNEVASNSTNNNQIEENQSNNMLLPILLVLVAIGFGGYMIYDSIMEKQSLHDKTEETSNTNKEQTNNSDANKDETPKSNEENKTSETRPSDEVCAAKTPPASCVEETKAIEGAKSFTEDDEKVKEYLYSAVKIEEDRYQVKVYLGDEIVENYYYQPSSGITLGDGVTIIEEDEKE